MNYSVLRLADKLCGMLALALGFSIPKERHWLVEKARGWGS
jgi:hypothetical protein